MSIQDRFISSLLIAGVCVLTACGGGGGNEGAEGTTTLSEKYKDPNVVVHELSDADMLHPTNYQGASSAYIMNHIFQRLLAIDFRTLELVPELAAARPEIVKTDNGGLEITYEIRPDAVWDDGTPITAKDVEFSIKAIKNPKVDNARVKPYYEFIEDIRFYEDNSKKFTLVCNTVYILAEASSGDYYILPKSIYDPEGLMDEFTIPQLNEASDELKNNPKITKFGEEFNSTKYQREKGYIVGSGAYEFTEWATGQKIVITKKKEWWGQKIAGENIYYETHPDQIIFQTINDQTAAIVALKSEQLDVMRSIKPKDFSELPESDKFAANYNANTPPFMAYNYIGINTRLPKFADKRTRQAFAHLFDVDKLLKVIQYGYGIRVNGPMHPSKERQYNKDIKPFEYDPGRAKELLAEVGWNDSDGDGTLDMLIDGEKTDLAIRFTINAGNDSREATAIFFQEECRKIGIKVDVVPEDWSIYIENQKNHDFEMYYGGWVSTPIPNDHKQIYHTESYNGGSNYTGFGNDYTDALIDSIRVALDEDKRAKFNHEFQQILHDECSYIFLYAPNERIAIHKRFDAITSAMRPGYWPASFKLSSAGATAVQ